MKTWPLSVSNLLAVGGNIAHGLMLPAHGSGGGRCPNADTRRQGSGLIFRRVASCE